MHHTTSDRGRNLIKFCPFDHGGGSSVTLWPANDSRFANDAVDEATEFVENEPLLQQFSQSAFASRPATHHGYKGLPRDPALSRLAAGTIGGVEYRPQPARSFGTDAVIKPLPGLASHLIGNLFQILTRQRVSAVAIKPLPHCSRPPIGLGHAGIIGARDALFGSSLAAR